MRRHVPGAGCLEPPTGYFDLRPLSVQLAVSNRPPATRLCCYDMQAAGLSYPLRATCVNTAGCDGIVCMLFLLLLGDEISVHTQKA